MPSDMLHADNNKQFQQDRVAELRSLARGYRDANNKIVSELWDIEQRLVKPIDAKDKTELMTEKENLNSQLKKEKYLEKLNELLEEIKNLEISLYGASDIGKHSPYIL